MKPVFADTSFFVAFLNPKDGDHETAVGYMEAHPGLMVTTAWVLAELGNFLAEGPNRLLFAPFVRDLRADPRLRIMPPHQAAFDLGLDLYARRRDKDWSFIDCISFVVMKKRRLTDALTADHHFEQAGFNVLLK